MKLQENNAVNVENSKVGFFKMVLDDKRKMRDYIRKFGTLDGFKSNNFEFAQPL